MGNEKKEKNNYWYINYVGGFIGFIDTRNLFKIQSLLRESRIDNQ